MADKSAISWTNASWNPTTGCSHVSPGCEHCYAEALSLRYKRSLKPWTAANATENVVLHPDRLDLPLRWREPRLIFVDSMSDLFHDQIPTWYIAEVFAVMWLARQHTFQVLTKRPARMQVLLTSVMFRDEIAEARRRRQPSGFKDWDWPRRNIWLGVSVEDQRRADERIPVLLYTPAAVQFLSCEPLLGPVDLDHFLWDEDWHGEDGRTLIQDGLGWVIAGGESGPGHRPMDPDWARSLRDQCVGAGVPFFYKQGSGPRPAMHTELDGREWHEMPSGATA